ncbi:NYN domain-containing protein [Patescibacteria group bacterium]|nr:NYN domain-containing protein [Patescibacteria group bacterium]
MMVQNANQRVGVFVDVSNLYHSAKNLYRSKVNFKNVLLSAVGSRQLVRAIAYAIKADLEQEKAFFEALEKSGFEVKHKDLQIFAGGAKKGDWDVGLALDAIKIASHLDVVVLISGDGDFIPLVSYLKENKGCRVEVVGFGKTTSAKLVEEADSFLDLDENKGKHLLTSRSTRARREEK